MSLELIAVEELAVESAVVGEVFSDVSDVLFSSLSAV
jgi:hypothetical protein